MMPLSFMGFSSENVMNEELPAFDLMTGHRLVPDLRPLLRVVAAHSRQQDAATGQHPLSQVDSEAHTLPSSSQQRSHKLAVSVRTQELV